jgi:hypothetical protein
MQETYLQETDVVSLHFSFRKESRLIIGKRSPSIRNKSLQTELRAHKSRLRQLLILTTINHNIGKSTIRVSSIQMNMIIGYVKHSYMVQIQYLVKKYK